MPAPTRIRAVDTAAFRPTTIDPPAAARIGELMVQQGALMADQVDRIVQRQRSSGGRFGQAAVALGYASQADVMRALGEQFHYPSHHPSSAGVASGRRPDLVTLNEPFGPRAEHFRALRSQLMRRWQPAGAYPRALAVISAERGDGRSHCAANLAVALAQLGGRTLLVDADLRRGRQHEIFQLQAEVGLSSVLSGRADGGVVQAVPGVPELFLLPAGAPAPNPQELVERPAFGTLIAQLSQRFAHVVVDTPAAAGAADAGIVAAHCGAALVVVRRHASRSAALQALMASLAGNPAELLGTVLNEF